MIIDKRGKMKNNVETNTEAYAPDYNISDWDFPLWSEILPRLWVGGTDDDDTLEYRTHLDQDRNITKDDFDTVITLYAWARPTDWLVEELRYGFYDSEISHIDMPTLINAVNHAYDAWVSGKRVLIRCQAGLNRSGLTATLVLMQAGFTAKDAIALLRAKRTHHVLCNEQFETFLLALDVAKEINEKE